ncbi:MAG TPA: hypothetical protein VN783_01600, partial [Thermoanaerobaculia bacterium]|nr:hypothetical protein [Thermoanaerobaculia bacterium]
AAEALAALPGIAGVRATAEPGRHLLQVAADADAREAVFRLAVERGWVLLELAQERASLEDVFVRLTTHHPAETAEVIEAAPSEEVAS